MLTFNEYKNFNDLANFIIEYNVDEDAFYKTIKKLVKKHGDNLSEEILSEALPWGFGGVIPGIARGASAVGGALGGVAGDVGRAVGRGAQAVGRGAQAAGGAVADVARAGAERVGQHAQAAHQAQALKQVSDRLSGLQDAMLALGINQRQSQNVIDQVNNYIQGKVAA
jgi:hypothetical protein